MGRCVLIKTPSEFIQRHAPQHRFRRTLRQREPAAARHLPAPPESRGPAPAPQRRGASHQPAPRDRCSCQRLFSWGQRFLGE